MKPRLIELDILGDERGSLVALEAQQNIPFPIARVYYIFGTKPGVERGFHAHRSLQQVAVAVSGACTMVFDDGKERSEVRLDDPSRGVYIGNMIWREMKDFTADCVLLVLADRHYDESDYLRNYAEFLEQLNG
ncbi:MAG: WxcM-like domain-containing protein [Burkholderiales bacterium]|nr:WxcM-like domain-containing protein [Burkholderiales bacterium]